MASLRPRACDFRRLRFSRSASFNRSCRESFTDDPDCPSRLALSSFIADPFEYYISPGDYTGDRTPCTGAGQLAPLHDGTLEFSASIGNWPFLGGIGRVKLDESCKMIEFEALFSPLKALAPQTGATGNRIGPELLRLKQEACVTADFFGPSWTFLSLPRACARGVLVARTGRL
jgi:hypothetical protein